MSILNKLPAVRCVSEFEDRDVEKVNLNAILEAASWTPSAAEAQPWEIVVIRSVEQKHKMVSTLLDSLLRPNAGGEVRRHWLVDAPLVLAVCLDRTRAKARYGDIGASLFGIQDSGAAVQNMRLVAMEQEIKSCLIREFDRVKLHSLLGLPDHVEPLVLIAMGYSAVDPPRKTGLPQEDNVHYDTW